jgi:hypothetical protein
LRHLGVFRRHRDPPLGLDRDGQTKFVNGITQIPLAKMASAYYVGIVQVANVGPQARHEFR